MDDIFGYIYDFIYINFIGAFEDIFIDYTDEALPPNIGGNGYSLGLINFVSMIVAYFITLLITFFLIYFAYRLIMFIVRRFINV